MITLGLLLVAAAQDPAPRQDYFELRGGLRHAQQVFEESGRGRVAFLGGSITAGPGWREQVMGYLTERFPDTEFDFVAAGIPSTGSTPGAFRVARDAFARGAVDLLFEEAAVNDSTNGRTDAEQLRGMEGIVRRARGLNPRVDVVLMHFVDPAKMRAYRAGQVPAVVQSHERVAAHYALPSLNLALEVTERIDRGEFTWEEDFRNLHPSPFGHDLYTRSITRLLEAAWADERAPAPRELPPPLDRHSYARGRLLPPSTASPGAGFALVPRWTNAVGGGTRRGFVDVPMLVGEAPGSSFRLPFAGSAVGLFVAAGPDAGTIEYRVDGGTWRTQDLFTRWSGGLHLPWLYMLEAELEAGAEHLLEVRIAATRHVRSKGHACRVVHVAVNDG